MPKKKTKKSEAGDYYVIATKNAAGNKPYSFACECGWTMVHKNATRYATMDKANEAAKCLIGVAWNKGHYGIFQVVQGGTLNCHLLEVNADNKSASLSEKDEDRLKKLEADVQQLINLHNSSTFRLQLLQTIVENMGKTVEGFESLHPPASIAEAKTSGESFVPTVKTFTGNYIVVKSPPSGPVQYWRHGRLRWEDDIAVATRYTSKETAAESAKAYAQGGYVAELHLAGATFFYSLLDQNTLEPETKENRIVGTYVIVLDSFATKKPSEFAWILTNGEWALVKDPAEATRFDSAEKARAAMHKHKFVKKDKPDWKWKLARMDSYKDRHNFEFSLEPDEQEPSDEVNANPEDGPKKYIIVKEPCDVRRSVLFYLAGVTGNPGDWVEDPGEATRYTLEEAFKKTAFFREDITSGWTYKVAELTESGLFGFALQDRPADEFVVVNPLNHYLGWALNYGWRWVISKDMAHKFPSTYSARQQVLDLRKQKPGFIVRANVINLTTGSSVPIWIIAS